MKKRFLTLILICAFTGGLLSPFFGVQAQGSPETETVPIPSSTTTPTGPGPASTPAPASTDTKTTLDETIGCVNFYNGSPDKCLLRIAYTLFYVLPAGILWLVAKLFNATLAITMSSLLFNNDFLSEAWKIVRDFSNIFFIIILLYAAFKMILGLGGSEVKKIISEVILIAIFINFSMFFTQIVIDSSNVLALLFYNKVAVVTKNGESITKAEPATNIEITGVEEKDFAGGIVSSFNPNNFINLDKFKETQSASWLTGSVIGALSPVPGGAAIGGIAQQAIFGNSVGVPTSITVLLIFVAGAIFLIASYAFFIAAFAFLGRLIEFWILIIFSPFAFMSFAMPELKKMDYIGWNSWSSRLFSVAFMAPIFMFFMLVISKLIQIDIFKNIGNNLTANKSIEAFAGILLLTILPAIVNLSLLMKAVDYAKKGSGEFSKAVIAGGASLAAMVGGLTVAAATGGTSMALRKTVGAAAFSAANNQDTKDRAAAGDKWAQRKLALANSVASKSFDFRETGLGKLVKDRTGLNMDRGALFGLDTKSLKDGYKGKMERDAKKAQDKMESYKMSGAAAKLQDAEAARVKKNNAEADRYENYDKQYATDLAKARAFAKKEGFESEFKESEFRDDYESKRDLSAWGLKKKGEGEKGEAVRRIEEEIKTSEEINKARRDAYLSSLNKDATKSMKKFWDNFTVGVGKTFQTVPGVGVTAGLAAATGGIGLVAAPIARGFLEAFKGSLQGGSKNRAEFINMVAGDKVKVKTEIDKEHLLHEMSEALGIKHDDHHGGHGGGHGAGHEKHEEHHEEEHHEEEHHEEHADHHDDGHGKKH